MKKITTIFVSIMASAAILFTTSCVQDLNVEPIDPNLETPEEVLNSIEAYQQLLAKCYGGLSVSASEGPDSSPDIDGIDGGYGQYMRALFHLQELSTDEASTCWNDQTIKSLHGLSWTTSDVFVTAMFSRIYYQIGLCNEFIRRGEAAAAEFQGEKMDYMIAQARGLRALSYYHAIDLFGNVPFATEENSVGATGPEQILRYDLYEWLVNEITGENNFRDDLLPLASTEYGRVSREFATMLLAKLYLNAEVFTANDPEGRPVISAWQECADESSRIIETVPLADDWQWNFSADNNLCPEIIFAVQSDGTNIQTYGSTNFVIKGSIVSGNPEWQAALGTNDGWGGLVVTPQFLDYFAGEEEQDQRYLFTDGSEFGEETHTREILDNSNFANGWCQMKFTNKKHDDSPADNSTSSFPDTDYPIFRAADAYLMLAEAVLNGAVSHSEKCPDGQDALDAVRERAGLGSIPLTEDAIISERARELYWENMRRQDLVRFGLLTSSEYVWDWKGGSYEGNSVDDRYNLYPIPTTEINSNNKLEQNPGY